MRLYFLIFGMVCILYYFILRLYTGRRWPTFSGFWLITGGAHLALGCAPFFVGMRTVFQCLVPAVWTVFLVGEIPIVGGMLKNRYTLIRHAAENRHTLKKCHEGEHMAAHQAGCIIILGAFVNGTTLSSALKSRLDTALMYLSCFPKTTVIVSGGQGKDEAVPEADAMADYLIQSGVPEGQIIREDRSVSTRENLRFSRKLADSLYDSNKSSPVGERTGIVTSDFHMFRTLILARQEGYRRVCPLPAPSDPVFLPNYLVREFFAVAAAVLSGFRKKEKNKKRTDGHNKPESVK